MLMNTPEYLSIIENIKSEIKAAQYRATIHANSDLLLLYYDIGTVINEYKTWGNKFIENLSYDIQVTFPERKGYSVRNLKYMAKFAARFADREIVQEVLAQITWYHNIALMDKVKTAEEHRDWDQFHSPANLAKSIVIEAAELLECFQWNDEEYDLQHVKEEIADVMVYCQNLLDKLGLDADEIINMKMAQNEAKYPVEKAKGSAAKYNQL